MERTKSLVITERVLQVRYVEPEASIAPIAAEQDNHVSVTQGDQSRLLPEYRFHGSPDWAAITLAVDEWIARDNPWKWPADTW